MSEGILCRRCRSGFLIDPQTHNYCGFCGAALHQVRVEPVGRGPFYLDQAGPAALKIILTNDGLAGVQLKDLEIS